MTRCILLKHIRATNITNITPNYTVWPKKLHILIFYISGQARNISMVKALDCGLEGPRLKPPHQRVATIGPLKKALDSKLLRCMMR